MNRKTKTTLTTSILAAIAAAAMLAGCSSHSSSAPGVAPAAVAHDPVIAYRQYNLRTQLADGLVVAERAEMDINTYADRHAGKLPTGNELADARGGSLDYLKYETTYDVDDVGIGGTERRGALAVWWDRDALAGKRLVLSPSRARDGRICWRVGSSTTVPVSTLALLPHANECQAGE